MTNIIKGIRNLRGYTQEDVAIAIGINTRTYWKKETHPELFTVGELIKLSKFLQVEESIFFKNEFAFKVN